MAFTPPSVPSLSPVPSSWSWAGASLCSLHSPFSHFSMIVVVFLLSCLLFFFLPLVSLRKPLTQGDISSFSLEPQLFLKTFQPVWLCPPRSEVHTQPPSMGTDWWRRVYLSPGGRVHRPGSPDTREGGPVGATVAPGWPSGAFSGYYCLLLPTLVPAAAGTLHLSLPSGLQSLRLFCKGTAA